MKKILITKLLTAADRQTEIRLINRLITPVETATITTRDLLLDAIASGRARQLDVPAFYAAVCRSTSEDLVAFLGDSPSARLTLTELLSTQNVLRDILTNKAGRAKTSDLSRDEQLGAAQSRLREKIKKEGRRCLNVWITAEAASYLEAIQRGLGCKSQAEAVEQILSAAIKREPLSLIKAP